MTLVIREAKEADLPHVLSLYAQPEIDNGKVLSLDEAKQRFRRFADYPDYRLFVAEEESVVVGSCALLIMDNLGHLGARSGVIEDVVVDPERQGAGIGRALIAHALAECRGQGMLQSGVIVRSEARAGACLLRDARVRAARVQFSARDEGRRSAMGVICERRGEAYERHQDQPKIEQIDLAHDAPRDLLEIRSIRSVSALP